jgi:biotin carboxylase
MSANEDLVLLIGSGWHPYREYLLQGLARQSRIWLIDERAPSWQLPYLAGSSVVPLLDEQRVVADRRGLIEAALKVATDYKVAGVLTYDEMLVTTTARIAELLGVRGLTVAGAENCRDKARTRAALTLARLPQPRYAVVHDFEHAVEAAARIGYPLVVKPRGMGASVGVVRAEGPRDLQTAFAVTDRARRTGPPAYEDGMLIEEYLDGPEISIDAVVFDGEYQPFLLARKELGPPPYFEEIGHLVDAADPLVDDRALRALLSEAHAALGVLNGTTHTEVRFTSRGPVIIEINGRLAGDLLPYVGELATGVNAGRLAAEIATGAPPTLSPTKRGCAAIRLLYPPEDCRVLEVVLPEPGAVPGLVQAHAIAQPGQVVGLPPHAHIGRYAYVMAAAENRADCELALDRAVALVELRYEPLDKPFEGRPW